MLSSLAGPTIVGTLFETASPDDLKTQYCGVHMWRDAIQQVLISEVELHCRIQALGRLIATDYQGR